MPNIAVFPELLRTHKPGSFLSLDESLEVQAAIARLLQADRNLCCCQEELCSQQPRSLFVQQGSGKRSPALFFLLVVGLFWPKPRCLVLGLLGLERRCALLGCVPYTCRTKGSGRWSKRTLGQVWSSGTSPAKPGCSAPCYFSGDAYDKQDFI